MTFHPMFSFDEKHMESKEVDCLEEPPGDLGHDSVLCEHGKDSGDDTCGTRQVSEVGNRAKSKNLQCKKLSPLRKTMYAQERLTVESSENLLRTLLLHDF